MPITIIRNFSQNRSNAVYALTFLSSKDKEQYPFQNTPGNQVEGMWPKGTPRKDRKLESLTKTEFMSMKGAPLEFMHEDYLWFTPLSNSRKAEKGKFSVKPYEDSSTGISEKSLTEYPALVNLATLVKKGTKVILRLDHVYTFVHESTQVFIFKVSVLNGQREKELAPVQASVSGHQENNKDQFHEIAQSAYPQIDRQCVTTKGMLSPEVIKHALVLELLDLGKGGDAAVRLDAIKTAWDLMNQTGTFGSMPKVMENVPTNMEISGGKGNADLLIGKVKSTNILENKRATKTEGTPMEMVNVRKVRGSSNLGSKNRLILEREDGKVAVIPKGKGGRNYQSVSFEMGLQKIPMHLNFQTPVKLQILSYQPTRKGGYEVLAKAEDGSFRKGILWGTAIIGTLDKSGAPTPYVDINQPYWIVPRQYEFQRLVECADPRLSTQAIPQRRLNY